MKAKIVGHKSGLENLFSLCVPRTRKQEETEGNFLNNNTILSGIIAFFPRVIIPRLFFSH